MEHIDMKVSPDSKLQNSSIIPLEFILENELSLKNIEFACENFS